MTLQEQQKAQLLKTLTEARELEFNLCINDLFVFFKRAWRVLEPAVELETNWHHEYICKVLQEEFFRWKSGAPKERDIVINIPPRTTKSMLVTVIYPVWCWLNAPEMRVITASYSMSLSTRHCIQSRDLILSDWFQDLFGHIFQLKKDENQKTFFSNTSAGFKKATSTGAGITGEGCNLFVYDDCLNPKRAASAVTREDCINWYRDTTLSRLNDQRRDFRIIVEQRLHEKDLTGYVLKRHPEQWRHVCVPAEPTSNIYPSGLRRFYKDGSFWSGRFPITQLQNIRANGTYVYVGQYLQSPTLSEGGVLKEAWFPIVTREHFQEVWQKHKERHNLSNYTVNFYMDTAYTAKTENDPSVIMATTKIQNITYILGISRVWLEFPDLVRHTTEYVKKMNYTNASRIKIEPKASGKSLVQQLKSETMLNVIEAPTPTDDKVTRTNANSGFYESKRIVLVEGDYTDDFIDEIKAFPKAEHDDQVDCLNMAADDARPGTKVFVPAYAGPG